MLTNSIVTNSLPSSLTDGTLLKVMASEMREMQAEVD